MCEARLEKQKLEHDLSMREDIKAFIDLSWEVIALRAYSQIFSARLQLGGAYQTLLCQNQELPSHQPIEGKAWVVQRPVLEVETKPLLYSKAPGPYTRDSRQKGIGQILLDETAIQSWRANLRQANMFELLNYHTARGIPMCHPP